MPQQEAEVDAARAEVAARHPEWMQAQRRRLEAQRDVFGAFPPTIEDFAGAMYLQPDALRPADPEVLRDLHSQPKRGPAAAARLLHRRGPEGLLSTGFEPQRHTVIVAGRPVQVLERKHIPLCRVPNLYFFLCGFYCRLLH